MLPYLFYDTEIPYSFLSENRPFRNAGDLFVSSCPSVINALRLCGAEERIIKGECSDFERFVALCYSMPYLVAHPVNRGINTILRDAFDIYEELTPYNYEEMWQTINDSIEEKALTPATLLSILNVESVCCRVSPYENVGSVIEGFDLYSICDLNDIIDIITDKKNTCNTLADFIDTVGDITFHSSFRIKLDKRYFYQRNSKKLELEGIYVNAKSKIQTSDIDITCLKTAVIVELLRKIKAAEKPLIIEANCDADQLDALFSYLELNEIQPEQVVLITKNPDCYSEFLTKHTFRNAVGMPSITLVSNDSTKISSVFPIGFSLQYQGNIVDVVSLTGSFFDLENLSAEFGDDVAENMSYGNIKNIFHI
jgi:hypothetical protein